MMCIFFASDILYYIHATYSIKYINYCKIHEGPTL